MSRKIVLALLLLCPACTTSWWKEQADDAVEDVLAEKEKDFIEFRESGLVKPDLAKEEEEAKPEEEDLSDVPRVVGLQEALAVATNRNRSYLTQKESLYLDALSLTSVRNQFSFFFTGTLGAILADSTSTDMSKTADASVGVSKILPTGGTASLRARGGAEESGFTTDGYNFDSGVTVSLNQPLLRDAGYETVHEPLTQAERDVVYAIREFELFREQFTIQVLSQFYSLVGLLQAIENAEHDLEGREFLRRQSQAKFEVGLATEVDKLRSEREYLRAKNDLIVQKQAYQLALDRFKIQLGLPTSFPLEIKRERPEYRAVDAELEKLVAAALNNRLDLLTAKDRVEDERRRLRIRTRDLLPDLDLTADYDLSSAATGSIRDQRYSDSSYTIGLLLDIPFERIAERNALRRQMVLLNRARRDLTLAEDDVVLQVRDSLRSVKRAEASIEIRQREILAAEKEARATQIRFEAGEMDNLRVTDARNAVLEARNGYIRDLVTYETARIQLLRDVGILIIDEYGMWVEP